VVVSIDADQAPFRDYYGGIIKTQLCGTNIGHAVLAIGYDNDP
jgi:hypothetical protein